MLPAMVAVCKLCMRCNLKSLQIEKGRVKIEFSFLKRDGEKCFIE